MNNERKHMTIGELRKAIADLPADATIGCITYDEDGDTWGHDTFRIVKRPTGSSELRYGAKDLDYYID